MVYVLDKNGKPLMPCGPAKARHLLKDKKAVIVNRTPFTIRLKFEVDGHTDPISLGVDAGSKHVGLSAVSNGRVLFEADVELRDDVTKMLTTRRARRADRRNRKRYREPRFNNRVRSKPKGWLAPTVVEKLDTHEHAIGKVCSILPVTEMTVEVADFNVRKLIDPDIKGEEYQHGPQEGYLNVREYVLARDQHCCTHCKKGHEKAKLEVHHIVRRASGGTNTPYNLITLCHECHVKVHEGKIKIKTPEFMQLKHATFMGVVRWAIGTRLRKIYGEDNVKFTFGYITKAKRIEYGLKKDHMVDARCIAGCPNAIPPDECFQMRKVRCHNRQIHNDAIMKNGKRKLHQSADVIKGFRLWDQVRFEGKDCCITGKRAIGYFLLKNKDWEKVTDKAPVRKIRILERRQNILIFRRSLATHSA